MLLVFIAPFVLPFSLVVGKAIGENENAYNATRNARSGCSSECVFPFTFLGETHNRCTDADHDRLWCATARDRNGEVTTWVNCDQDCRIGDGGGSFGLSQCVRDCRMLACDVDLNTKVGCNQMFNCAQACKMRDLGLSRNECSRQCRRNGGSGCSPRVRGFEFELCARCNRKGCSRFPSVDECQIGCNYYRDEPVIPETRCPTGWVREKGDIPGAGQIEGAVIFNSIRGCTNHCRTSSGCCSVEYSPSTMRCNLNRDCSPPLGSEDYRDYVFCKISGSGNREGEDCGSCFCPPTFTAGECEEGLVCVPHHDPRIADAPGTCQRPSTGPIRPPGPGGRGSCRCNGFVGRNRGVQQGECRTRHQGRRFCYVDQNSRCADRKPSNAFRGMFWSHGACQRGQRNIEKVDEDNTEVNP